MAATLLHLVDEHGQPVPSQVRLAVEAAFRWAEQEYQRFDRAVLAEMAEALAVAMCRRQDRIELPRRYAVAALAGKLQEWYRAHPAVEIMLDPDDLEQVMQAEPVPTTSPDLNVLFAEMKAQLSERDRQVLVLLEQDLGPQEIAKAFEISYFAAAKAIQRARDRMAAILSETGNQKGEDNGTMTRPRAVGFKIW
jgi:DNA-directed RNA polymerase specialized sigma24 family protein